MSASASPSFSTQAIRTASSSSFDSTAGELTTVHTFSRISSALTRCFQLRKLSVVSFSMDSRLPAADEAGDEDELMTRGDATDVERED
jgi:hypothetical protein